MTPSTPQPEGLAEELAAAELRELWNREAHDDEFASWVYSWRETILSALYVQTEAMELLADIRACRSRVEGETVHGTHYEADAWTINKLTALLPRIDNLLGSAGNGG